MVRDVLRVVATLASPLAGDAPQLDGLLVDIAAHFVGKEHRLGRGDVCPPVGSVPIPVEAGDAGGQRVYRCSSPILGPVTGDRHEHYCQRMDVGLAHLQAPGSRRVLNTTGGPHKAYRLPLRVRDVASVVWFAVGNRREILRLLRRKIDAIGKKTSQGYGRVASWDVERVDIDDPTWFAESPQGVVLMRPLPVGDWLPLGLLGARRDFGACQAPYWHPGRNMEVVVPC